MISIKKILLLVFSISSLSFPYVSDQEAIGAIPLIGYDIQYHEFVTYIANAKTSLVPLKLALKQREKDLKEWRDSYAKNYTVLWLMAHLIGDSILAGIGVGLGAFIGGGHGFMNNKTSKNAMKGAAIGVAIPALFATKNILVYYYGWLTSMVYSFQSVDIQISRLESLLAVMPS
jgi:hypothetical protein